MILLLVVGGGLGGWAGLSLANVTYRSRAQIQVLPVVQQVFVGADPDKAFLPMFEAYVQAQANWLQSERVRTAALQDPEWVKLGRGSGDKVASDFVKTLHVTTQGAFVYVDVIDREGNAAWVGTKSMMRAYGKIYQELVTKLDEKRMDELRSILLQRKDDYTQANSRISELVNVWGTENLEQKLHARLSEEDKNEADLASVRRTLANLTSTTQPSTDAGRQLTTEQIGKADTGMARLLTDRRAIEERLLQMRAGDILPNSPAWKRAKFEAADLDTQIDAYGKKFRDDFKSTPTLYGMDKDQFLQKLQASIEDLVKLRDKAHQDWLQLGKEDMKLRRYHAEADIAKQKMNEAQVRIDQLNIEGRLSGRVSIVSDGERPLEPFLDERIRNASMGGLGGSLLGLGLILGVGLMDRRLRYVDDAVTQFHLLPMLGILPELSTQSQDPDQAALVSHCVHQIRGLLQIQAGSKHQNVFAVTSPVAGTGKTTLTHALGVSFAHANTRTLLIDCDMVGGGLSARIDAQIRRKLGRILRRAGRITPEQLTQALKLARGAKKPLGEMLMELGAIDQADLSNALTAQKDEPMGLLDAIAGDDLIDCIAETGVPNLSVLPLGLASSDHVSQLSPTALHNIIEQARRKFDMVLIDTGPIPGSLEAAAVAAAVDGVILAVSRGEQRPLAEHCMNHLNAIGASVVGIVFNRAGQKDIYTSGTRYLSSTQALSSSQKSQRSSRADAQGIRISPVVNAVTTRAPGNKNGTPTRQQPIN